jgi:hypothetical protein
MKPCVFCGKPSEPTFDHVKVFDAWAAANHVLIPDRSRFDGIKKRLEWAAKDETDEGCHPECALRWAITEEKFEAQYPVIPDLEE